MGPALGTKDCDGVPEGAIDVLGVVDGAVEGEEDGAVEGDVDGAVEGADDGSVVGAVVGAVEVDGDEDGAGDGAVEVEGAIEVEGAVEVEGALVLIHPALHVPGQKKLTFFVLPLILFFLSFFLQYLFGLFATNLSHVLPFLFLNLYESRFSHSSRGLQISLHCSGQKTLTFCFFPLLSLFFLSFFLQNFFGSCETKVAQSFPSFF